MKLTYRHLQAIKQFLRYHYHPYVNINTVESSPFFRYHKIEDPSFIPDFGQIVGNFVKTGFNTPVSAARTTSSLIQKVFCGYCAEDSNGEIYYASSGIITDHNHIPLIYTERYKDPKKHHIIRCVINSYVFKRETILSKFLVDTLIPLLLNPSYRKDTEDSTADFDNSSVFEVVLKDISASFWDSTSLGMTLDKEKISTFTKKFCEGFRIC